MRETPDPKKFLAPDNLANISVEQMLDLLIAIKEKPTIAYLGGTFDLFHPGHVHLLRQANKIANRVVVSLNTDEFILQYKGKLPVMSYAERKDVLESCKYVYEVIENIGGYDSKPAILQVGPDFIVHGDDWVGDAYFKQMGFDSKWLDEHNIQVVYVPYKVYDYPMSSTEIKRRITES